MSKTISNVVTTSYVLSPSSTPLVITTAGGVEVTNGTAISAPSGQTGTVINAGSVTAAGDTGIGIDFTSGGSVGNSGFIGAYSSAVRIDGGAGIVTNTGDMTANADAVVLLDGGTITDDGTISAVHGYGIQIEGGAGTVIIGGKIDGNAGAVQFGTGYLDRVVVQAGAVIDGGVDDEAGTGVLELAAGTSGSIGTLDSFGSQFVGFETVTVDSGASWVFGSGNTFSSAIVLIDAGTMSNTGSIGTGVTLGGTGAILTNSGLLYGASSVEEVGEFTSGGSDATVINSGTIETRAGHYGVVLFAGGDVTNSAGGIIRGGSYGVAIEVVAGTVVNAGTISTSKPSQSSGILLDAAGSKLINTGVVGAFEAGIVLDAAASIDNTGLIGGYGGVLPGGGAYEQNNAPPKYGILADAGAATVTNAGTVDGTVDAIKFAGGVANRLIIDPGAVFDGLVLGGTGTGSSNTLELATGTGTGTGTLSGFGSLFTNFETLQVDSGADWVISGTSAGSPVLLAGTSGQLLDLRANATLSGIVESTGGVLELAVGTAGSIGTLDTFGSQFVGFGTVTVDSGASWVFGSGNSFSSAIVLIDAGAMSNTGSIGTGVTLGGTGAILTNSGLLYSESSVGEVAELSDFGSDATVVNSGTIETRAGDYGVVLFAGGDVTNSAGGIIRGGSYGVAIEVVAGTVVNAGTISTSKPSQSSGILLDAAGSKLINTGVVGAFEAGIVLDAAASIDNTGLIGGYGGVLPGGGAYEQNNAPPKYGILANTGAATITNDGTVDGTVDAIKFAGGVANRLIIDPGAVFDGLVLGGTGAGSSNTIELASGTGVNTLSGIGSLFTNFETLQVDSGADWVVSGTSAGSPVLLAGTSGQLLVLQASATLSGIVESTGGVLELAAGTAGSIGTLDTFGSQFVGFGTVTVDSGASWVFGSGNSFGSATVLIDAGTMSNTGSIGTGVTLGGTGAILTNSGLLYSASSYAEVGEFFDGGSTATVVNSGTIETRGGDYGVVLIAGGDVTNSAGGIIRGGSYGVGITTVASTVVNAGTISASKDAQSSGILLEAAGSKLINTGVVGGLKAGIVLDAAASIDNTGLIGGHGGTLFAGGAYEQNNAPPQYGIMAFAGAATVTNAGTVAGTYYAIRFAGGVANRLIIDPGAVFDGLVLGGNGTGSSNTIELASGTGTLSGFGSQFMGLTNVALDSASHWRLDGTFVAADTITLLGSGDVLTIDSISNLPATIANFGTTDTIDLRSVVANQASLEGSTLDLFDNGTDVGSLVLAGNHAGQHFTASSDHAGGTDVVACFAAGTCLLTPDGERLVETLVAGDEVMTEAGYIRSIRWVGHRPIVLSGHPAPSRVRPVCIAPGAFGPGLPHRALRLSPEHAVFTDGVLIPVHRLVNGTSITIDEDSCSVTYHHVELERHDIVLAEGLPAESYLDTGNRAMFVEADATFPASGGGDAACAFVVEEGPILDAVRLRLGCGEVSDVRLDKVGLHCLTMPDNVRALRLLSTTGRAKGDDRRLGIAVRGICLDGIALPLSAHAFQGGFHGPEAQIRWTDGAAMLQLGSARQVDIDVVAMSPS